MPYFTPWLKLSIVDRNKLKKIFLVINTLSTKYVNKFQNLFLKDSVLKLIDYEILRFFYIVWYFDNFLYKKKIIIDTMIKYVYYFNILKNLVYLYKTGPSLFLDLGIHTDKYLFAYDLLYKILYYHIKSWIYSYFLLNPYKNKFSIKWHEISIEIFIWINESENNSHWIWFWFIDSRTNRRLFSLDFFVWESVIFITNIQYTRYYFKKYKWISKLQIHRYAFDILKQLVSALNIWKIYSYYGKYHPTNFWVDKWDYKIYDKIGCSLWFKFNWYYYEIDSEHFTPRLIIHNESFNSIKEDFIWKLMKNCLL